MENISSQVTKNIANFIAKNADKRFENLFLESGIQGSDLNFEDPLVKLVNFIINDSINKSASDVHIEPFIDCYRVRYRIDGILHNVTTFDVASASRVCSRIKILANLNIVEHRSPQDGRFSFRLAETQIIDCRISICPTINGEKIVIRFLNKANADSLSIDSLCMENRDKMVLLNALSSSQGLILVTGPTGSGKSTTLYTALTYLNKDSVNIISVEDPVEMHIPGINQIQVNSKSDLHFATILRSILRQDPDVIMIGEIRDLETARIAMQASETGHLVLASLHTNSAAQTISRLINLGIPIHNLLNSVKLIIAQRLLRKLCKYCGFLKKSPNYTEEIPSQVIRPLSKPATKSKLQEFSASKIGVNTQIAEDLSVESVQQAKLEVDFEPKANIKFKCDKCHFGYHGRNAIFEVMPISHQITKILSSKHFDLTQLENIACAEGMQLLKNAGLELVNRGITSLEELGRVVAI